MRRLVHTFRKGKHKGTSVYCYDEKKYLAFKRGKRVPLPSADEAG
jgi:hypothetical protein